MTVQQSYTDLTLPHLAIYPYKAEAEKIALTHFCTLSGAQKEAFLAFLKQVYKEKSGVYQSLAQNFESYQRNPHTLNKTQMRCVLSAMPIFLPAPQQIEVLALEIWEHLQKQKLALTRHFTLQPNLFEVLELFAKYKASTEYLTSHPSAWFYPQAYQEAERSEIIEAVIYLFSLRLHASMVHFMQDMRLILSHTKDLSHKIIYFIEFLGIEVHVGKYEITPTFGSFSPPTPPIFKTVLAPYLHEYLAYQTTQQDYHKALQVMQESVLANDLTHTLKHYKKSKRFTNIVELSFSLKGGAGIAKLSIKSWLSRIFDIKLPSKKLAGIFLLLAILTQILGKGWSFQVMLSQFFYFSMFLSLAHYLIALIRNEEDKNEEEHRLEREKNYKQEMYIQQYEHLLKDKKEDKKAVLLAKHIGEQVENYMLKTLEEEIRFQAGHYPNYILELFEKQIHSLIQFKAEDIPDLEVLEATAFDKQMILEVGKYLILRKIGKSFEHFTTVLACLIAQQTVGKYYVSHLHKECALLESFYESHTQKHQIEPYFQKYHDKIEVVKEKLELFTNLPAPVGEFSELLKTWLQEELTYLDQDMLTQELQHIKTYLYALKQNAQTPYKILPLILEGTEGIVYV
jgi:hypothetical protein